MISRILVAMALSVVVMSSLSANAGCVPGRIEADPRTGTVVVELPECHPPPPQ